MNAATLIDYMRSSSVITALIGPISVIIMAIIAYKVLKRNSAKPKVTLHLGMLTDHSGNILRRTIGYNVTNIGYRPTEIHHVGGRLYDREQVFSVSLPYDLPCRIEESSSRTFRITDLPELLKRRQQIKSFGVWDANHQYHKANRRSCKKLKRALDSLDKELRCA